MTQSERTGYYNYMRTLRRAFHAVPEPSFGEYRTQERLEAELDKLSVAYTRVGTGLYADIAGRQAGPLTAFRADMDALPLTENTGAAYASRNPGYMHACGHDGHMANLMTFARYLAEHPPRRGVRLIFQPAEEGEGGAKSMIDGGCLDGCGEIYALHVDPLLPAGSVGVCDGAGMAGTVEFDVEICGRSAHAAQKGSGVDALRAANHYFASLYEIADSLNPERLLLHAGRLASGSARNIVANLAVANCTFRYFDHDEKRGVLARLEQALAETDAALGTRSRLIVQAEYIPVINHPDCVARVRRAVESVPGCRLVEEQPRFTAEDFAFYEEVLPGAILWLGVGSGENAALHTPEFDFREEALMNGLDIFIQIIRDVAGDRPVK